VIDIGRNSVKPSITAIIIAWNIVIACFGDYYIIGMKKEKRFTALYAFAG
jgi:hypothetical protein